MVPIPIWRRRVWSFDVDAKPGFHKLCTAHSPRMWCLPTERNLCRAGLYRPNSLILGIEPLPDGFQSVATSFERTSMIARNNAEPDGAVIALTRILRAIALLLAATAALVIFVAIPAEWLDRWHVLTGYTGLAIVMLLSPLIISWGRAGSYLLLVALGCEVTLVLLKPGVRKARLEAMVVGAVCVLTYLYLYSALRFNFH